MRNEEMMDTERLYIWNIHQLFPQSVADFSSVFSPIPSSYKSCMLDENTNNLYCLSRDVLDLPFDLIGQKPPRKILSTNGLDDDELIRQLHDRNFSGQILSCVESHEISLFRDRVDKLLSRETFKDLPTPGSIFYLNSRTGMRDFLINECLLADRLPSSAVCHSAEQVSLFLKQAPKESQFVVKSNFTMGGIGMAFLNSGDSFEASICLPNIAYRVSQGASKPTYLGSKVGSPNWNWSDEPFVIESLIGSKSGNRSVTVDLFLGRDGSFKKIGISEQILSEYKHYVGIRSINNLNDEIRQDLSDTCLQITEGLNRRGYFGPVNIDYVLTTNQELYVIEVNLRYSAPYPIHWYINKIQKKYKTEIPFYKFFESVDILTNTAKELLTKLACEKLIFDGKSGMIPFAEPFIVNDGKRSEIPILILSHSQEIIEDIQSATHEILQ